MQCYTPLWIKQDAQISLASRISIDMLIVLREHAASTKTCDTYSS